MAILKNDFSTFGSEWNVTFVGSGSGTNILKTRDTTTTSTAHIKKIHLSCMSEVGVNIFDGSTGTKLNGLQCVSGASVSQVWDYSNQPIMALGGDDTDSICISVTNNTGEYLGFIQGYWG